MDNLKYVTTVALILLIVGGLNWGLVGFCDYNLVTTIFGEATTATKVVYDLVGIAAVYLIIERLIYLGRK